MSLGIDRLRPRGHGPVPRAPVPVAPARRPRAEAPEPRASLRKAGPRLEREARLPWRARLTGTALGSAILHTAIIVLLCLEIVPPPGGKMSEPTTVDMMFTRPGSSGMAGPTPTEPPQQQAPPPAQSTAPEPQPQPAPEPPEQKQAVAPPPPSLPTETLPPEGELPKPAPQPPQPKPAPRPQHSAPQRLAIRPSVRSAPRHSASPLSSPMDLSFSEAPSRSARHVPHFGSHSAVDLSIGPMVKNGQLNTPYASASVRGVSDDYGALIDAWIKRHMFYPEDAAQRGEDGPSSVHVKLGRDGRVRGVSVTTSSGSYALDDATVSIFRNAKLPPVPPDMKGNDFDIDLTINYILLRH